LARCKLDISNQKFRALIGNDADLESGLNELRDKVAQDHRLSGWFNQTMSGKQYVQYQNKIWKWDFAPAGDTSSTRKGWRLFAYVENPNGPEPILATPFFFHPKPGPKGKPAEYVAEALKRFLSLVVVRAEEEKFRRQTHTDGRIISLCYVCCDVLFSSDAAEADIAEDTHDCPGAPKA